MKRIIALGAGLVLSAGAASAQQMPPYPLPQPPASTSQAGPGLRSPAKTPYVAVRADSPAPAPARTATPAPASTMPSPPITPTVPPPCGLSYGYGGCFQSGGCANDCGTPLFNGGLVTGEHYCFDKFVNWLCFKPGPRVTPVLVPTPYMAPLRSYFKATGCGAGCGTPCPTQPACPKPPLVGIKLVNADPDRPCRAPLLDCVRSPWLGNGGLVARTAGCCPVPGPVCYGYCPPAPAQSGSCATCTTGFGRIGSVCDNVLSFLVPGYIPTVTRVHETTIAGSVDVAVGHPYAAASGCANPGNCYPTGVPGPTLAGYRLANPFGYPNAMGAYPSELPAVYNQSAPPAGPPVANPSPTASLTPNHPFTNP